MYHPLPKFDPRVKGYTLSTEITPIPTRGVKVAVNTEEDCTTNVKIAPDNIATYPVNQGHPGRSEFNVFCIMTATVPV